MKLNPNMKVTTMAKQTETPEQINARVLATVTVDQSVIAKFKAFTGKNWPAKFAGAQPTDAMLMVAALFAKSAHAVSEPGFLALLLRDCGSTDQQHNTGFNCRNAHNFVWHHATGLTSLGYFKREQLSKGCWRVHFTPKGEKYLAQRLAQVAASNAVGTAPAKPVKAKKAKAKKAKPVAAHVAPVQAPATDTAPAADGSVLIPAAPSGDAVTDTTN